MLKKASVVVGVATASLLALSPLAFAGNSHGHHGHHGKQGGQDVDQSNEIDDSYSRSSQGGLVNVDALNGDILGGGILNNSNVCPNAKVDVVKLLGVLGFGQDNENQNATCVNSNGNTGQKNDR